MKNETLLKKTTTSIVLFLFLFFGIGNSLSLAQERIFGTEINRIAIGKANASSPNINSPTGTNYQDLKKSVCNLLYEKAGNHKFAIGSGFLVNTINNSFDTNANKKIYLLTAYHNDFPVGKHLFDNEGNALNVSDEDKKEIYISFDREVAHSTKRTEEIKFIPDPNNPDDFIEEYRPEPGDIIDPEKEKIKTLWRVKLKPLVQDFLSDIALYEIVPYEDHPWTVEDSEIFQHVYTAPWTLRWRDILETLNNANDRIVNISHPQGDLKKVFVKENTEILVTKGELRDRSEVNPNYTHVKNDRVISLTTSEPGLFYTEGGSSGSPVLNKNSKAFGIFYAESLTTDSLGKLSISTHLENSWYHSGLYGDGDITYDFSLINEENINNKYLQEFLDPNETWISQIKGGYLKDLISNDPNTDFDLEVTSQPKTQTIQLKAIDFFKFKVENSLREKNLGYGLLLNEEKKMDDKEEIFFSLRKDNGDQFYLISYSKGISDEEYIEGKFKAYEAKDLDPENSAEPGDLKNALLNLMSKQSNDNSFTYLREFQLDDVEAKIYLMNGDTRKVRAIKLPQMMPWNAAEIFDPNRYTNMWRSYKYPESRGKNSENLYIDKIKIEEQVYIYDDSSAPAECKLLDPFTLQEIETGDNGGYLNLVNPNYKIDNVLASDSRCGHNKLITTLYTNDNTVVNKHMGSFMDYTKQADTGTLLYNFTNATTRVREGTNPTTANQIVVEHEIPFQENLSFPSQEAKSTINARYRIGLADEPLTQEGIYENGEVEDYLVKIRKKESFNSREDWINIFGPLILSTSTVVEPGQCLPDGTATGGGDNESSDFEGIDETFPTHQLPLFGIGDQVCSNILDIVNTYIGSNALKFNGLMFMDIARGSKIVHQATSEKTISIDFLVEETNVSANEILFEEGGGANGLSIRRNGNSIEYGVRINDNLQIISSTSTLVKDQMTNVTIVFEEGVMELYINGEAEATSEVFADQNITTIPEHLDEASLGGTMGQSIWGTVMDNFNGVVDYFAYWTEALTPVLIGILARPISSNNGRISPENIDDSTNYEAESQLTIFPNPVKEELNILVEVRKEGQLKLAIYDLNGREVYKMSRPRISEGFQLITLNDLDLPAGNYIVKVQAANTSKSEQIVVE